MTVASSGSGGRGRAHTSSAQDASPTSHPKPTCMRIDTIHCVRHAEDDVALCGAAGMQPALDLFTGSWQHHRLKFPDQPVCPACDEMDWRSEALAMQKERFELNLEVGIGA